MDGKLVLKNINTGKVIEMDFDIPLKEEHNENLPKIEHKNIKNNIKDDTMTDTKEDLTTDSKKVIDGKEVDTPAEGDDYEAGDKVKGDPYNETEKYEKDMADFEKRIMEKVTKVIESTLHPIKNDLTDFRKDKETKEAGEKADLLEMLQEKPYEISLDLIKDLTLEQLKNRKEAYDQIPMIKDFILDSPHLTHRDVKKSAFDMEPVQKSDAKGAILKAAQSHFKTNDLGDERYKTDFGGAY